MAVLVTSGIANLSGGPPSQVSVSANPGLTDISNAFLLFGLSASPVSLPSALDDYSIAGYIADTSNVVFERSTNLADDQPAEICWWILEDDDITVQRGSQAMSATSIDITLGSNVTKTNSFPKISVKKDADVTQPAGYDELMVRASLIDGDTLRLETQVATTNLVVKWEVVESTKYTVQEVSGTFGSAETTSAISLTPLDDDKTFVIGTYQHNSAGTVQGRDQLSWGLSAVDTLGIERTDTADSDQDYTIYVVEMSTGQAETQRVAWSGASSDISISSVDVTKSMPMMGGLYNHFLSTDKFDSPAQDQMGTVVLSNSTSAQIMRHGTGGNVVSYLQVVEFAAAAGGTDVSASASETDLILAMPATTISTGNTISPSETSLTLGLSAVTVNTTSGISYSDSATDLTLGFPEVTVVNSCCVTATPASTDLVLAIPTPAVTSLAAAPSIDFFSITPSNKVTCSADAPIIVNVSASSTNGITLGTTTFGLTNTSIGTLQSSATIDSNSVSGVVHISATGTGILSVSAMDDDNNTSTSASSGYIVDVTSPVISFLVYTPSTSASDYINVNVSITDDVEIFTSGVGLTNTNSSATSIISGPTQTTSKRVDLIARYAPSSSGTDTIDISAADWCGYTTTTSSSTLTITSATGAPIVIFSTATPSSKVGDTCSPVIVSATVSDGGVITSADGLEISTNAYISNYTSASTTSYVVELTVSANTNGNVVVSATDGSSLTTVGTDTGYVVYPAESLVDTSCSARPIKLKEYLPAHLENSETGTFVEMFETFLNELYYCKITDRENESTVSACYDVPKISILEKINRLANLHDPDSIDIEYIQRLASYMGYDVSLQRVDIAGLATGDDLITQEQQDNGITNELTKKYLRFAVSNLPNWYKIKTTRNSVKVLLYSFGLIGDIVYRWSSDQLAPTSAHPATSGYGNDIAQWSVNDVSLGSVDSVKDIPSNYFPTPHFTIKISQNDTPPSWYTNIDKIIDALEDIRPINTVMDEIAIILEDNSTLYVDVPMWNRVKNDIDYVGQLFVDTSTLTVLQPNGGESLIDGQSYDIEWTIGFNTSGGTSGQGGPATYVDLYYVLSASGDPAKTFPTDYTLISAGVQNLGTYTWTVPTIGSSDVIARVQEIL